MFSLFFPWGVLLQALALIHFMRRRPDSIWLWIIIFLGPIGALVYIGMEVAPDAGLLREVLDRAGRRRRIAQLEAIVLENPAAGNYEELADLHLELGHYARARACYDKAISGTTDLDPVYRRGIASLQLGDIDAAVRDLDAVIAKTRATTSTARLAYWPTPMRPRAIRSGPMRCSARRSRSRPSPRPTTTTRSSSPRRSAPTRPATGPAASSRARPRCRATCSGASGTGSAGPRCS